MTGSVILRDGPPTSGFPLLAALPPDSAPSRLRMQTQSKWRLINEYLRVSTPPRGTLGTAEVVWRQANDKILYPLELGNAGEGNVLEAEHLSWGL